MDYNTKDKIEQFAEKEFGLKPLNEKTLRMIDFVNADFIDSTQLDDDEAYNDGLDEGECNERARIRQQIHNLFVDDKITKDIRDLLFNTISG